MKIQNIDINNENPIFILGPKRSGTTLLRRIIDAHSRVTIPPPGWFYHFIYDDLYSYGDLNEEKNIIELINDCLSIPLIKDHWSLNKSSTEILKLLPEKSFRGILTTLFHIYMEKENGDIWGSKSPSNVFWVKEIKRHFPNARYILLIRDGRDVSIDQKNVYWGPNNLYTACLIWKSYTRALLKAEEILETDKFIKVYYEDLVKNPQDKVNEICSFLKLKYEPGMLNYYQKDTDSFVSGESYHKETNKPITDKFVGMYNDLHQSDRELQVFVLKELLLKLGYEVHDKPRKIGYWEKERYLERDRHGGQVLDGAIEFKDKYKNKCLERRRSGLWNEEDRIQHLKKADANNNFKR